MSRGNKVVLSIAPQTDVNIKPQSGWQTLPRKSDSLNHSVELTDSETINDSRLKSAGMPTSATAEGDVEVEFAKGAYDALLEAAAHSTWDNNVLRLGGDEVRAFAIEKAYTDTNPPQHHLFKGMRVNTLSIDIPETGFIGVSFGFMGAGYEQGSAAYATGTKTADISQKASSLTVGDIKINGSTMQGVGCVTGFKFELNNNIEKQACLGAGLYGSKLLEMMAEMSGSLTLAYSAKTQEILNKALTGETVQIEATINTPDGSSYVLNIPKAQVSGDLPSGGATDILSADVNYTVIADDKSDAPTLTRTLA
ncbi:hypothetical protein B0181_10545 [Moraxella caviae]|uniref:Uncharacterized protein n=1 Tax=Moraxella caviae TaxID=34060 RepID=A0A1S9ZV42_9GAMM|nr:phage tail tube protein [Moraxella caviae]OOR87280.1 hypothetical protein B0181_10545 [Moraxella caviae]STZ14054.1 Uncharacterised protein [Moraxella caviae]